MSTQQPKVARLNRNRKSPKSGHNDIHLLGKRFMWKCHFCKQPVHCRRCFPDHPEGRSATRDHYIPKSKGGRGYGPNIVLACLDCNRAKGDTVPEDRRGQR